MSSMSAKQKIAAARRKIAERWPYMYTAVLTMIPVARPGLGSFALTRKGCFMYDPDWLAQRTVGETTAMLAKCMMHLMREHAERGMGIGAKSKGEQLKWNKSTSMAVNVDLHRANFKLPPEALMPKSVGLDEGLLPEKYYRELPDEQGDQGNGQGDQGEGEGKQKADGWGDKGGSGMGYELDDEPTSDGQVRSNDELTQARKQFAEEIRKASKERGDVPGGLLRWADAVLEPPKIPWQQQLARVTRNSMNRWRSGKADYRFAGTSRRQAALGYGDGVPILPKMMTPVPRITVAADTSGSMGPEELKTVVNETASIIKTSGGAVQFLACDAQVHEITEVRNAGEIIASLKGGGGTSFVPVFEKISEMVQRPDILIFITDGMGQAPAEPPSYETIWVLVGPYKTRPCEWGKAIEVEDD